MDTITITREQFNAAVMKCNTDFLAIVGEKDESGNEKLASTIMFMQNIAFCATLEDELFNGKEEK